MFAEATLQVGRKGRCANLVVSALCKATIRFISDVAMEKLRLSNNDRTNFS
jgi:hypothetical protein